MLQIHHKVNPSFPFAFETSRFLFSLFPFPFTLCMSIAFSLISIIFCVLLIAAFYRVFINFSLDFTRHTGVLFLDIHRYIGLVAGFGADFVADCATWFSALLCLTFRSWSFFLDFLRQVHFNGGLIHGFDYNFRGFLHRRNVPPTCFYPHSVVIFFFAFFTHVTHTIYSRLQGLFPCVFFWIFYFTYFLVTLLHGGSVNLLGFSFFLAEFPLGWHLFLLFFLTFLAYY